MAGDDVVGQRVEGLSAHHCVRAERGQRVVVGQAEREVGHPDSDPHLQRAEAGAASEQGNAQAASEGGASLGQDGERRSQIPHPDLIDADRAAL